MLGEREDADQHRDRGLDGVHHRNAGRQRRSLERTLLHDRADHRDRGHRVGLPRGEKGCRALAEQPGRGLRQRREQPERRAGGQRVEGRADRTAEGATGGHRKSHDEGNPTQDQHPTGQRGLRHSFARRGGGEEQRQATGDGNRAGPLLRVQTHPLQAHGQRDGEQLGRDTDKTREQ